MNLPNKLTMLRILLIPVFMVVLYWDKRPRAFSRCHVFTLYS